MHLKFVRIQQLIINNNNETLIKHEPLAYTRVQRTVQKNNSNEQHLD